MKKTIAILLMLVMVLGLAACDSGNKDAGYYLIDSVTEGSDEYSRSDLEALGLEDWYIYLKEDGTGSIEMGDDEPVSFTWEKGKLTADGETLEYKRDGDYLTIETEGLVLVYKYSGEKAPSSGGSLLNKKDEKTEEPEESTEPENTASGDFEPVTGTIAGCDVAIVGAEEFTDSDSNPAVRFYYDFTNNTEDTLYTSYALSEAAEQEGYELVATYANFEDDAEEYGNSTKYIRPGVTIRCVAEYAYKPEGGTLVFTLGDYLNYSDETLSAEFDPQALPGRPEALEIEKISNPTWIADWDSEGVYKEDYYIKITEYELVKDWDGEDAIRVYMDFTNNSEEATSLWWVIGINLYQDGIQLESNWAETSATEDDNYSTDVEPGGTITASVVYTLRSDSPVEVEIADSWSESYLGAVIPLN